MDKVGPVKRRTLTLSAALSVVTPLWLGGLVVAPADAVPTLHTVRQAVDEDPLEVTLQTLTPSVIPHRGPIELSGLIVNRSDETWTDLKIYPWRSVTPISTVVDLDLAAETDPELSVGTRIIETYEVVDELPPGGSTTFHLTVPRSQLGIENSATGVYWMGVQVLATSDEGRDEFTDGRARTFIPLLSGQVDPVRAALVVPIRHDVIYARNGSLRDVDGWLATLQPGGQLRNLIQFIDRASGGDLTVLVDPAVVEAIQRLAEGNPVRDLGPADVEEPEPTPSATEGSGESSTPSASGRVAMADTTKLDSAARWAGEWLDTFERAASDTAVLALPYGDLDVDSASQLDPSLIDRSLAMTASVLEGLGIQAPVVVQPPSGYVRPSAIASLPTTVRLLVSSNLLSDHAPDPTLDPTELEVSGHDLRLVNASASAGGPLPGSKFSALQMRQRLLAETALRALGQSDQPVVMALPNAWNPGVYAADFFPGIAQDWLTLTPESFASIEAPTAMTADELVYPDRIQERELGRGNFTATDQLIRAGETLQRVLTHETEVAREVAAQALTTASYTSRDDPVQAEADAAGATRAISRNFRRIQISAPPYVTLSSATGRFRVDLSNDLEQAITVRIEAITDGDLTIEAPAKVRIKGQSSTTVLLNARSTQLGVHQVTLLVTDVEGTPLGPSDSLPIRANEVGRVIWVIIGAGAALLFGAIGLRLYRRITRRRQPAPAAPDEGEA